MLCQSQTNNNLILTLFTLKEGGIKKRVKIIPGCKSLSSKRFLTVCTGETFPMPGLIPVGYTPLGNHLEYTYIYYTVWTGEVFPMPGLIPLGYTSLGYHLEYIFIVQCVQVKYPYARAHSCWLHLLG